MSKTFEYFYKTGEIILPDGNWDGNYGEYFDYEVSDNELLSEIAKLVCDIYFNGNNSETVRKGIEEFISDFDLLDDLVDTYESELKDIFEKEALKNYDF